MARPHPLLTQLKAAFWIAEADLHWHSKSVAAQLTPLAAEKMHDSAHLGTASALFWQGEVGTQAGPLVMVPLGLAVVAEVVSPVWEDGDPEADELAELGLLDTGPEVLEAGLEQGVVGLAFTQLQRADTEVKTCMPVATPQPPRTQLRAPFWIAAADLHWHSKSVAAQLTPLAAEKMHDWAHLGTASALFWQGEVGMQAGPLVMVPLVMVPLVTVPLVAVPLALVVVVDGEAVSLVLEAELELLDDELELLDDGLEVLEAWVKQGVVGLAVTQPQRADTEVKTCMPVAKPQPPTTQLRALFWIAAADLHWHSKSVLAQLTTCAAEKMHDWAHLGTASALFWQGDVGLQAGALVTGPEVMGPVVCVVVVGGCFAVVVTTTVVVEVGEVLVVDEVVVVELGVVVVLAGRLVQGVVGLAVTQLQRADTEVKT